MEITNISGIVMGIVTASIVLVLVGSFLIPSVVMVGDDKEIVNTYEYISDVEYYSEFTNYSNSWYDFPDFSSASIQSYFSHLQSNIENNKLITNANSLVLGMWVDGLDANNNFNDSTHILGYKNGLMVDFDLSVVYVWKANSESITSQPTMDWAQTSFTYVVGNFMIYFHSDGSNPKEEYSDTYFFDNFKSYDKNANGNNSRVLNSNSLIYSHNPTITIHQGLKSQLTTTTLNGMKVEKCDNNNPIYSFIVPKDAIVDERIEKRLVFEEKYTEKNKYKNLIFVVPTIVLVVVALIVLRKYDIM